MPHRPVMFLLCIQTFARCSSLNSCSPSCSFPICKSALRTVSSLPEEEVVWRSCMSLGNRSPRLAGTHFSVFSMSCCIFKKSGRTSACRCIVPKCFSHSSFTDRSVIIFVMLCYHNMESGCCCQFLIYGTWPQRASLRFTPNICSAGFKCFLLWDKSHTNISTRLALLSFTSLACGGWHSFFCFSFQRQKRKDPTIKHRTGKKICWQTARSIVEDVVVVSRTWVRLSGVKENSQYHH